MFFFESEFPMMIQRKLILRTTSSLEAKRKHSKEARFYPQLFLRFLLPLFWILENL